MKMRVFGIFLLIIIKASIGSGTESYGRIVSSSPDVIDDYRISPESIDAFLRDGCTKLPNVLTEKEVKEIEIIFDKFLNREVEVPGKDFCDMSKPFNTPFEEWSIVNAMLPTKYYPKLANNIYERLTTSIAKQIFPQHDMMKDYDQLLNKRPGKQDAIFSWHQDMGYWPGSKALNLEENETTTITFSLAIDDSDEENGCLRYVVGSGAAKQLRDHKPLGKSRDDAHALTVNVDEDKGDIVRLAECSRGSVTLHDEWVVHGSGGNNSRNRQRRTYVIAFRAGNIVRAERAVGFTHSHNDEVNWDTFDDGIERTGPDDLHNEL